MTIPSSALSVPTRAWQRCVRLARAALRISARAAAACVLVGCAHHLAARVTASPLPNVALPTAGGSQVWTDVAWDRDWRIQQHAWTGHARLLDPSDIRRAWGSVAACRIELAAALPEAPSATSQARPTAILLHGLWRTRDSMQAMGDALREHGYDVIDMGYPSTLRSIEDHAESVADVLNGLDGGRRKISFVTHSLGGLVLRQLLDRKGDPWRSEHSMGRAVLIAAPNQGSEMARIGARIPGALHVYGVPSQEIAAGAAAGLPTLPLPFLTVAAARGTHGGWNPWIAGDDDGVVTVDEARLAGAEAHVVVHGLHTFVMRDPCVIARTTRFLTAPAAEWAVSR